MFIALTETSNSRSHKKWEYLEEQKKVSLRILTKTVQLTQNYVWKHRFSLKILTHILKAKI